MNFQARSAVTRKKFTVRVGHFTGGKLPVNVNQRIFFEPPLNFLFNNFPFPDFLADHLVAEQEILVFIHHGLSREHDQLPFLHPGTGIELIVAGNLQARLHAEEVQCVDEHAARIAADADLNARNPVRDKQLAFRPFLFKFADIAINLNAAELMQTLGDRFVFLGTVGLFDFDGPVFHQIKSSVIQHFFGRKRDKLSAFHPRTAIDLAVADNRHRTRHAKTSEHTQIFARIIRIHVQNSHERSDQRIRAAQPAARNPNIRGINELINFLDAVLNHAGTHPDLSRTAVFLSVCNRFIKHREKFMIFAHGFGLKTDDDITPDIRTRKKTVPAQNIIGSLNADSGQKLTDIGGQVFIGNIDPLRFEFVAGPQPAKRPLDFVFRHFPRVACDFIIVFRDSHNLRGLDASRTDYFNDQIGLSVADIAV